MNGQVGGLGVSSKGAGRERFQIGLAALLYVSVAFALLHDTLIGDQVLSASQSLVVLGPFTDESREGLHADDVAFADTFRQFEPWTRYAAQEWSESGSLPLWKDDSLLGAPLLGNGQSSLLYPPHFAAIALGAPTSSYGWRGLITLVTAALSTWLLARHLRCGYVASLIAGACVGFYGFNPAWLLWPHSNVSCLFPLLVLATLRVVERPGGGRLVALAAVCAVQHLGGHPETALLSQLTAYALGVFRTLQVLPRWRDRIGRLAAVATGFVLGGLLGGPQLVPLVEYLQHSEMLAYRQERIANLSTRSPAIVAGTVLSLLLAGAVGGRLLRLGRRVWLWAGLMTVALVALARMLILAGSSAAHMSGMLAADWLGGPLRQGLPLGYHQGSSLYPGPALALVLAGLILGSPRPWARLWTGVLILAYLVQARTPGLQELLESMPIVGLMPSARAAMVVQLAMALLAAFGYDALRRTASAGARSTVAALLLVALLVSATTLAWSAWDGMLGRGAVAGDYPEGVRPLKVDLAPAERVGDEPVTVRGTFNAPGPVDRVAVQWHLREEPTEASFQRQHAATRVGRGRYVFEADLPGERLSSVSALLRVQITLRDGRRFLSPALRAETDLPTLLASAPLLPMDGDAAAQLLVLLAVGAGTLLLMGRPSGPHPLLLLLVLAGVPWFTPARLPRTPIESFWPDSPALAQLAQVAPQGRVITTSSVWLAESLAGYGIPQVLGDDALIPYHTAQLLRAAIAPHSEGVPFKALTGERAADDRLVDLLAARLSAGRASDFKLVKYEGYLSGQRLEVFENHSVLARARLVPRARVEPDDEAALRLLADPDFDLVTELVLADGEDLQGALAPGGAGTATVALSDPDRVVIDIAPAAQAYLLLADSYFPGWVARVDGERRTIHRADVALRAVRVGPGDKRVEFRYQPGSWRLGWALAGFGLAACLVLAFRWRRQGLQFGT